MNIKLKYGDLTLVRNDTIITHDDKPLSIIIEGGYTVVLSFEDDSSISDQKIDISSKENGINITLINFNNPLGTATSTPIDFAKQNGNTICISLCVYKIGSSRLVFYNLYTRQ